jgi:hypothetical protein
MIHITMISHHIIMILYAPPPVNLVAPIGARLDVFTTHGDLSRRRLDPRRSQRHPPISYFFDGAIFITSDYFATASTQMPIRLRNLPTDHLDGRRRRFETIGTTIPYY